MQLERSRQGAPRSRRGGGALTFRLPSTFARTGPTGDPVWPAWSGVWTPASTDRVRALALAPRLPRAGKGTVGLSGFIADGPLEGAMFFSATPKVGSRVISGDFFAADSRLSRSASELTLNAAGDLLTLRIEGKGSGIKLSRVDELSDMVTSVSVLGHRALGFGDLENTRAAFDYAWYFGASGIEFDVSVPYVDKRGLDGKLLRYFDPLDLRVAHPWAGFEAVDVRDPNFPATDLIKLLAKSPVPFFYIDPKVSGLAAATGKLALTNMLALAGTLARSRPDVTFSFGAPDDIVASRLQTAAAGFPPGLSWTLECAPGRARWLAGSPGALAADIGRVSGAGSTPLLDLLLPNLSPKDWTAIRKRACPFVFFTVNRASEYRGVLRVAKDPKSVGYSLDDPGAVGIMTDYPHRIVSWLAGEKG